MGIIKNILFNILSITSSRTQTIFIMAHMRSGSSLLEHILSSNSDVLGTGEQSRIYNSNLDIKKSELFIRKKNQKLFNKYKFIIDQILHNKYTPNLELLNNNNIKFIFLIRNPDETISSIENLGGPYGINEKKKFSSSSYYSNRIEYLIKLSKLIPEKDQIFITYDQLIFESQSTLNKLTSFLQLKTSLKTVYNLKQTTGKLGDTSKNIKEGVIVKTKKNHIEIDTDIKNELNKFYLRTCIYFDKKSK